MVEQEPKYEDSIRIVVKAFGRISKAEVTPQACSGCKPHCPSDCQDWVSNVASTGGAWAGVAVTPGPGPGPP